MNEQTFEDALGDLLARHKDEDLDDIISALELKLMALREEAEASPPGVDEEC